MTTRAELIHQIRCAPDEMAPVLVYADWLQDRDDPRGKALANLHADGLPVLRPYWSSSEPSAVEREWLAPIDQLGAFRPEIRRGLVRWVSLRGRDAANLGAICELEPVIGCSLDSTGRGPAQAVADSGALDLMRELILAGKFDAGCEIILGAIGNGLTSLALFHALTAERAAAIVASGPRPTSLLIKPEITGAATLAAGATLEGVEKLDLGGDTPGALAALAAAPLASLRQLNLQSSTLNAADLDALGPRLDRVEALKLPYIGGPEVDALVRHIKSGNLRELDVNLEEGRAQKRLLGSRVLAGLETLDMQFTQLSKAAVRALQRSPHRGKLSSMWLSKHRPQFALSGVAIEWEGW